MEEAEWRKTQFKSEVHCIPTYYCKDYTGHVTLL